MRTRTRTMHVSEMEQVEKDTGQTFRKLMRSDVGMSLTEMVQMLNITVNAPPFRPPPLNVLDLNLMNRPTSWKPRTWNYMSLTCMAFRDLDDITFHRRTQALSKDNSHSNSHSEVMWISDKLQRKLCTVELRGVSLPSFLLLLHCTQI